MAESFVTQGVNVICSNMQIPGPNKLGLDPDRANAITNTVYNNKNADHFLTVADKKIEKPFECKVTGKFWGGLTRLCAGIVIGLAVLGAAAVIIGTGGAAGAILLGLLATAEIGAGIAAGIGAISVGVHAWKSKHDCDVSLESPNWQNGHEGVKIQGEYALLSSSNMACAKGGVLQLVESEMKALIAGKFISENNREEVKISHEKQLLIGVAAGLTGGGSAVAVPVAIGFYLIFEDKKSNQEHNIGDDVKEGVAEHVIGTSIEEMPKIYQQTTKDITRANTQARVFNNLADNRVAMGASEEAIASYRNMAGMAENAPKHIVKDGTKEYFTNPVGGLFGIGLAGAVVGFGIDQYYKDKEREKEDEVRRMRKMEFKPLYKGYEELLKVDDAKSSGVYKS